MRRDMVGDWRLGDDASRPAADSVTTVQTKKSPAPRHPVAGVGAGKRKEIYQ